MKYILYIAILFIGITSCKKVKLDQLAFPLEKLDKYELEDYQGEVIVPDSYNIPKSLIHLFPLTSKDAVTGETHKIYAIYIGNMTTISNDTVILYAHGQSKHMDNYWSRAKLLANTASKNNYGLLMMDYRGYGMSEGNPSERGLSEDVEACIEWLKYQGVQSQNTIYYAYSLGCIPAIDLVAHKTDFTPSKLIIESPLASVENLTQSSTLINVDPSFITSLKFNNAENMKLVKIPLLWLHGREDTYIELSNGQVVYDNHTGAYKEAHIIDASDHTEIPETMGFETYLNVVNDFIIK